MLMSAAEKTRNSFCTYVNILVEQKMNVKHEIRKIWAVDIYFDMDYTLFYRI